MATRRTRIHISFAEGKDSSIERALRIAGVDPTDHAAVQRLLTLGALAWARGLTIVDGRDGLFALLPGEVALPPQATPYIERAASTERTRVAVAVAPPAASNDDAQAGVESSPAVDASHAAPATSAEVKATQTAQANITARPAGAASKEPPQSTAATQPAATKSSAKAEATTCMATPAGKQSQSTRKAEQGKRDPSPGTPPTAASSDPEGKADSGEQGGKMGPAPAVRARPPVGNANGDGDAASTAAVSNTGKPNHEVPSGDLNGNESNAIASTDGTGSGATELPPGSPLFGTEDDIDALFPALGF